MSFSASYPGHCRECSSPIEVGDQVAYVEDRIVHADCVDAAMYRVARGGKEPDPCPRCFLIHAGPCDR